MNNINQEESRLFDLYQEIITNIDNKEGLNDKIKEYITKSHLKSLQKQVENESNKQDNYIDYIIEKLPKIK